MHSSRMRTARSSSCLLLGGLCISAYWDTPPRAWAWTPPPRVWTRRPPTRPPNLLPRVWAWRPPQASLPTSTLGLGLDTPLREQNS